MVFFPNEREGWANKLRGGDFGDARQFYHDTFGQVVWCCSLGCPLSGASPKPLTQGVIELEMTHIKYKLDNAWKIFIMRKNMP